MAPDVETTLDNDLAIQQRIDEAIHAEVEALNRLAQEVKEDLVGSLLDFCNKALPPAYSPYGDRVLMKVLGEEYTRRSGGTLFVVGAEEPWRGVIVRTNDYVLARMPALVEGTIVVFAKWSGQEITVAGEQYRLVKMGDLLATIG